MKAHVPETPVEESYGTVPFVKVVAALKKVEEFYPDKPIEDIDITFEFLIGSFFPEVLNNINKEMERQHTLGYKAGLEDARKNQD